MHSFHKNIAEVIGSEIIAKDKKGAIHWNTDGVTIPASLYEEKFHSKLPSAKMLEQKNLGALFLSQQSNGQRL